MISAGCGRDGWVCGKLKVLFWTWMESSFGEKVDFQNDRANLKKAPITHPPRPPTPRMSLPVSHWRRQTPTDRPDEHISVLVRPHGALRSEETEQTAANEGRSSQRK